MMPSKPNISNESLENKENCQIEPTIACYEAIQFSYFDNDEMKDWMQNEVGVDGAPYNWGEESGC